VVILSIQPGVGYRSDGDSLESPVVPFDSAEADVRWGKLVVRVDEVLSGSLPAQTKTVSVAWEVPTETDLSDLNSAAKTTAGHGIFFLSPGAERLERTGKKVPDQKYYSSVYLVVGSAAFIDSSNGFGTPLLDPTSRSTLVGTSKSLDEVAKRIKP